MQDRDRMQTGETYEAFRKRMQAEYPDPERCEHGMLLAHRCIRCEDESGNITYTVAIMLLVVLPAAVFVTHALNTLGEAIR